MSFLRLKTSPVEDDQTPEDGYAIKVIAKLCLAGVGLILVLAAILAIMRTAPLERQAQKGRLLLLDWQIEQDPSVALIGEWEVYWRQLKQPKDFNFGQATPEARHFNLPNIWNNAQLSENPDDRIGAFGFATFRLVVDLPPNMRPLALKVPEFNMAYKLWVNGEEKLVMGQVGRDTTEEVARTAPAIVHLPASRRLDLVLQVSNHVHREGGAHRRIVIGAVDALEDSARQKRSVDIAVAGAITLLGLFHLLMFTNRKRELAYLYLGVTALAIALRILTSGKYLLLFVPVDHITNLAWEYASIYFCILGYLLFFRHIYPDDAPNWLAILLAIPAVIALLVVALFPPSIFTYLRDVTIATLGLSLLSLLVITIRQILVDRRDAILSALSLGAIALTTVHDMLFFRRLIESTEMGYFGFMLFVFGNAAILSRRMIYAFQHSEELAEDLTNLNNSLEEKVRERTNELERLAAADSLTGILNRRAFLEMADKECNRSQRYDHALSLLMIDADHFKRINDQFGHDAGDHVLKAFCKIAQSMIRDQDLFARLGGEEFALLLPETDLAKALDVAERLKRKIADSAIVFREHAIILTVSIGVATRHNVNDSLDNMLLRSDAALRKAKENGRNRVEMEAGLKQV